VQFARRCMCQTCLLLQALAQDVMLTELGSHYA